MLNQHNDISMRFKAEEGASLFCGICKLQYTYLVQDASLRRQISFGSLCTNVNVTNLLSVITIIPYTNECSLFVLVALWKCLARLQTDASGDSRSSSGGRECTSGKVT